MSVEESKTYKIPASLIDVSRQSLKSIFMNFKEIRESRVAITYHVTVVTEKVFPKRINDFKRSLKSRGFRLKYWEVRAYTGELIEVYLQITQHKGVYP